MNEDEIDCFDPSWQALLKERLQDGKKTTVINFDYTTHGQFCEVLAMGARMSLWIDHARRLGIFTPRPISEKH